MCARWPFLLVALAVVPLGRALAEAPSPPGPAATAAPTSPDPAPAKLDVRADPPKLDPTVSAKPDEDLPNEELGLGWALLRTVLVLGAVVALAYLTLNIGLRKLLGIKPQPTGRNLVTVLERVPLDQKRALFVVKAANEVLLLGASDNSLELIARLDANEVEKVRAEPTNGTGSGLQLSPFLQKLLGRKDAPPPASS